MSAVFKKIFIVFIGLICLFPAFAFAAGWYTDTTNQTLVWPYRQQITISGASVEATLSNFPVLIKITDATNPVFSKAQSTGNDILFTASDETTKLDHQIDYYNGTGNSSMCAWVRMPTLVSTSDSTIYMYYGSTTAPNQENKTTVWDSDYKAVWHLSEGGTGTRYDSTSNARNGTPVHYFATGTNEVISLIGKADKIRRLGGTFATSQYITFDATNSMALNCATGESLTISCWISPITFEAAYTAIFNKGDSSWRLQRWNYLNRAAFAWVIGGTYYAATEEPTNVVDGNWHYVVGIYDTSNGVGTIYYDGTWEVSLTSTANRAIYNNYPADIGMNSGQTGRGFTGTIDEVRISKVVRSRSWVRTEYKNQYNPSSFCTFSAEEYRPSATLISKYIDDPRKKYAYLHRHSSTGCRLF